jgi:hypothetical protein
MMHSFRRFIATIVLTSAFAATGAHLRAQDARQIVEESDRRSSPKSQRYEGVLQVIESNGKKSEKRWSFQRLGSHGNSRTIIRFTAPAEVKGVALLVVSHPDKASDQWMWTPAIERDRRIALQDRSTRFFGTDFSFEDLEERDVSQFDYTLLGEEAVDGVPCFKIQAVAKQTKSSQYSKSILWIQKDRYAVSRIESYVKNALARRLTYSDFRDVKGIWTAHLLSMADVRRRSETRLVLGKVDYNVPYSEDAFTLQALRRQ